MQSARSSTAESLALNQTDGGANPPGPTKQDIELWLESRLAKLHYDQKFAIAFWGSRTGQEIYREEIDILTVLQKMVQRTAAYEQALQDVASGDETSTVSRAVAIAKHALVAGTRAGEDGFEPSGEGSIPSPVATYKEEIAYIQSNVFNSAKGGMKL